MIIRLKDLSVFAFHGVYDYERKAGTNFSLDVEIALPKPAADALESTLDYTQLAGVINEASIEETFNLLETWAEHLIDAVMTQYAEVISVKIRIRKPGSALDLPLECVEVESSRTRE
jgi:dihydroneopterin aldolase